MQNAIVDFWRNAGPARWYAKDEAFDQEVRARFLEAHESAARGELWDWESEATGALALILLLDQFPRNLFRGSAHAFATDSAALEVAQRAIAGVGRAVERRGGAHGVTPRRARVSGRAGADAP